MVFDATKHGCRKIFLLEVGKLAVEGSKWKEKKFRSAL